MELTENHIKLLEEFCKNNSVYIDLSFPEIGSFVDLFEEKLIRKQEMSEPNTVEDVDGNYELTERGRTLCKKSFFTAIPLVKQFLL